ncbi:hypothetical protein M2277_005124 [Paenibacillus sp. LBL]|uniref:hypothetical protein n=1 Tax=Paenibacillus sp. LBL TaxID=2940563 RepID=UPI002475B3DA|nr:hypothetical protein [Paenibacillus sp. LBL]MDH6674432.1 hypothetical protein [Paenibacillus sp. LBL]
MVKLELLSPNLVQVLNQLIADKEIAKYLFYNQKNPLSQPDIALPATNLMFKNIFPYPFDLTAAVADSTQIRVYYPNGELHNREIIQDSKIVFDIVVAKSLWLVNDGAALLRPYEIMRNIVGLFSDKSVGTVGRINFSRFFHLTVNDKFDAIRLEGNIITFGTS